MIIASRFVTICISLFLLNGILSAQTDNKFVIGSWFDPRLTFTNQSKDLATLDSMAKAHFNLLSGYNLTHKKSFNEFSYVLGLLEQLQSMKLLAMGEKVDYKKYDKGVHGQFQGNFRRLSASKSKYLSGYHLGDEPSIDALGEVNRWVNELKKTEPDKLTYIGLFPIYVGYDTAKYRKYIDDFCRNKSEVVGIDLYPFINGMMRGDYFWNLWVLADVLKKYPEKRIWNTVYAVEHYFYPGPNEPITMRYSPVTLALLRFVVHAPLLYGTKGILYFTYESPGKDNWDAEFEPAARENPIIYNFIKSINDKLRFIGNELMPLTWVETVHGATKNNYSTEMLPVVGERTPFISALGGNEAAAAIYTDKNKIPYVLLMNKDTLDSKFIRVDFKIPSEVEIFNDVSAKWEPAKPDQYNKLLQRLTLAIDPAEVKLVRIKP